MWFASVGRLTFADAKISEKKLVNKLEPTIYEVNQGIDLWSPDAATYGFESSNFTLGVGFFYEKYYRDGSTTSTSIDLTELLHTNSFSTNFKAGFY